MVPEPSPIHPTFTARPIQLTARECHSREPTTIQQGNACLARGVSDRKLTLSPLCSDICLLRSPILSILSYEQFPNRHTQSHNACFLSLVHN